MIFVTLPHNFIATKYPGYYWHITERRLYSLKVNGVLRPLKIIYPNRWNNAQEDMGPYYKLSHEGKRVYMSFRTLERLVPKSSVVERTTTSAV